MERKPYPTDLTDEQWKQVARLLPAPKRTGRPRTDLREILDAIFFVLRTGCAWRMLPHDFPPWQTVYHHFRLWRIDGTWGHLNARLREAVRRRAGRREEPRVAVMDSQSVKTSHRGGPRGFDAGKKGQRSQTTPVG